MQSYSFLMNDSFEFLLAGTPSFLRPCEEAVVVPLAPAAAGLLLAGLLAFIIIQKYIR